MSISELRLIPVDTASTRQKVNVSFAQRALPLVMTVGRTPLIYGVVAFFMANQAWMSILLLVIFIVIDIFDGGVARKLGVETSTRRFLDGFIDRLSVHIVILAIASEVQGLWIPWLFLAVRDIAQALAGAHVLAKHRLIAAGAKWHRSYTLSLAAWGMLVLISREVQWVAFLFVLVSGIATLVDYLRKTERITCHVSVEEGAANVNI